MSCRLQLLGEVNYIPTELNYTAFEDWECTHMMNISKNMTCVIACYSVANQTH